MMEPVKCARGLNLATHIAAMDSKILCQMTLHNTFTVSDKWSHGWFTEEEACKRGLEAPEPELLSGLINICWVSAITK